MLITAEDLRGLNTYQTLGSVQWNCSVICSASNLENPEKKFHCARRIWTQFLNIEIFLYEPSTAEKWTGIL